MSNTVDWNYIKNLFQYFKDSENKYTDEELKAQDDLMEDLATYNINSIEFDDLREDTKLSVMDFLRENKNFIQELRKPIINTILISSLKHKHDPNKLKELEERLQKFSTKDLALTLKGIISLE